MFTGEYRHTVDDKGRVAVPVRFRADLAGRAYVSKWLDDCLAIHPGAAWDALAAKISTLPITDPSSRAFSRYLFGAAFEIEIDKQGRVVIPSVLRDFAQLGNDAVVVGSHDHLELWSPQRWDDYNRRMDDPEVFAQHLQGLGI